MRIRVTLRSLLVLVVALAIWMAIISNRVRTQQAAVRELSEAGITVHYDYQHAALSVNQLAMRGSAWELAFVPNPPKLTTAAPDWLQRLLGDDYFCSVTATTIPAVNGFNVDDVLPSLRRLPYLQEVILVNDSMSDYEQLIKTLRNQLPKVTITDAMDELNLL